MLRLFVQAAMIAVFLAFSGPLAAQSLSESSPAQPGPTHEFKLGPGDVISVFVWRQPTLSKTVSVGPDGSINYPLIGEIEASGQTLSELQDELTKKLMLHLSDPQVTVTLDRVRSFRVFVLGEVLRPGMFELTSPITVVQAIAMAGGFTAFASRDDILVYNELHDNGSRRVFDYNRFVRGKGPDRDIVLTPFDTVIIK